MDESPASLGAGLFCFLFSFVFSLKAQRTVSESFIKWKKLNFEFWVKYG